MQLPQIEAVVLMSLMNVATVYLLAKSVLLAGFRSWLDNSWLRELLSCPYCQVYWLSVVGAVTLEPTSFLSWGFTAGTISGCSILFVRWLEP